MCSFIIGLAIEEGAGGDSSKSNSITSERSVQSVGVSASSQSSSTNSIPPILDFDENNFSPLPLRSRTRTSFVSYITHKQRHTTHKALNDFPFLFLYNNNRHLILLVKEYQTILQQYVQHQLLQNNRKNICVKICTNR